LLKIFLLIIVEEEPVKEEEEEEQRNWLYLVNLEVFDFKRELAVFCAENTMHTSERRSRERKKSEADWCIISRVPRLLILNAKRD
jgi:hypothetical protein